MTKKYDLSYKAQTHTIFFKKQNHKKHDQSCIRAGQASNFIYLSGVKRYESFFIRSLLSFGGSICQKNIANSSWTPNHTGGGRRQVSVCGQCVGMWECQRHLWDVYRLVDRQQNGSHRGSLLLWKSEVHQGKTPEACKIKICGHVPTILLWKRKKRFSFLLRPQCNNDFTSILSKMKR